MEDNKVIMTLETYTKLVLENAELKRTLSDYKRKILNEVDEKISESLIYKMNEEETIKLLEEKNKENIFRKFGLYTWTLKDIVERNFYILSKEDVENYFIERVRYYANDHLNDLLKEKKEAQEC